MPMFAGEVKVHGESCLRSVLWFALCSTLFAFYEFFTNFILIDGIYKYYLYNIYFKPKNINVSECIFILVLLEIQGLNEKKLSIIYSKHVMDEIKK